MCVLCACLGFHRHTDTHTHIYTYLDISIHIHCRERPDSDEADPPWSGRPKMCVRNVDDEDGWQKNLGSGFFCMGLLREVLDITGKTDSQYSTLGHTHHTQYIRYRIFEYTAGGRLLLSWFVVSYTSIFLCRICTLRPMGVRSRRGPILILT